MSNFDPNRRDPAPREVRVGGRQFNWSWIIGGIAAIVVLIVALSFGDRTGDQTALIPPASTTGQGSGTQTPTPPPANPKQ